ncbi:hypothetical protein OMAG_001243 [Candidatus Omnitrophus magneticus]|uniref:Uncharacterized protein n=1 Tax=Candidatus Omnitrophus magneticus TaxID=1609969 RepID=A0A0F0CTX5_9BACT|nr:hypothetical protein OMAG_001243 [Candidatus Omnitrophus magneticus]
MEKIKGYVYPAKLKELDSKITAFQKKELELSAFADYLNKTLNAENIKLKEYPNFEKLVSTLEYEKKINFDIVDQERSQYIDVLGKKMSKEAMNGLVAESIKFKKGHIKAVDFYSYLRDKAKEYNIDMYKEFPNLFYYYIYTKLYEGIDNENLFKEIDKIEIALKEKFFTTDTEKNLDKHSKLVTMYVNLINIELTNEDYDLFKEYSSKVTVQEVISFFANLCSKYGINDDLGEVPAEIIDNLPNMIEFYEVAMKRDNNLIENTLKEMNAQDKNMSVLITGGFHTKGMKALLEKKGISYVVVMPKITKDIETPYIKVLTNQRTSLEAILTESAMPGVSEIKKADQEQVEDNGETLSPLLKFAFVVNMTTEELRDWSNAIGKTGVIGAETLEENAKALFDEAVTKLTTGWLDKIKGKLAEEMGKQDSANEWNKFVDNDILWEMLLSFYLGKYVGAGVEITKVIENAIKENFNAYRVKEQVTPGEQAVGEVVNPDIAKKIDGVIKKSFDYDEVVIVPISARPGAQFVVHKNFIERLVTEELPVNIHPGRGGKLKHHLEMQIHIDKYIFDNLTEEEKTRLVVHELSHLDIFNIEEAFKNFLDKEDARAFKDEILGNPRFGVSAYERWIAWKNAGKPIGEAQEKFINSTWALAKIEPGIGLYSRIERLIYERVEQIKNEKNVELTLKVICESEKIEPKDNITPGIYSAMGGSEAVQPGNTGGLIKGGDKVLLETGLTEKAITTVLGENVTPYEVFGEFNVPGLTETISINSSARIPAIVETRDHEIEILSGTVYIVGSDGTRSSVYNAGDIIKVTKNGIVDKSGATIQTLKDNKYGYMLVKESVVPANVKLDYEKNAAERASYAVYSAIKAHLPSILKGKIDIILPKGIFTEGSGEGSKKFEQKLFHNLFGDDVVNIYTYNNALGLNQNEITTRIRKSIESGRIPVLGATNVNIAAAEKITGDEFKEIMASVRTLALPDITQLEKTAEGWLFAREVEGLAILQAILTAKSIDDKEAIAMDIQRVMTQLTNRAVSIEDLYYMLPFESVPLEIKQKEGVVNSLQWMVQLVQKLLLQMPIQAFNPTEQLEQRRKVMWSV